MLQRDKIITLRVNSDLYKKVNSYLDSLNDVYVFRDGTKMYLGKMPDGRSHGKYSFADFVEYLLINHLPKDFK